MPNIAIYILDGTVRIRINIFQSSIFSDFLAITIYLKIDLSDMINKGSFFKICFGRFVTLLLGLLGLL